MAIEWEHRRVVDINMIKRKRKKKEARARGTCMSAFAFAFHQCEGSPTPKK
jgi:hypothetical protein